ncbi:hypothetical protein [Psychrobacillus phage Perkons]|nr:hypothetical protein [Psychrobacillus phage Perkons]
MVLIILTLVVVILFAIVFLSIDWIVHIDMVKSETKQYGKAGYKKFIEEFEKVKWEQPEYLSLPKSLFTPNHCDKYHANIILFNRKGMIINNPVSWLLVKKYVKKYLRDNFGNDNNVKEWR